MSKVTKRVLVEFEFESDTEEVPYIKDWWLRDQVMVAVQTAMPSIKDRISLKVEHLTTNVLPEEITVKVEDILSRA